jgi:hypothetical protein
MKRTTPVYLLALVVMLCAIGLALAAKSPETAAASLATPVPGASFHYSTVGACGCEVQATGTMTPTLMIGFK